jgi:uncharacterized protein YbjT (DUF2867 family)
MQKILVIGATGMIGKTVTRELVKAGYRVTIMARNLHKASKIFPGETIVDGDVFDQPGMEKAFTGQDVVYISLSPPRNSREHDRMPEREGIDNIIAAAQATGIKRLVLLSALVQNYNGMHGFHWWIFDMKISAVEKVRASGIPYTIFYPSTFMECFDQLLMQRNFIMLAGKSKAPMYFIAAADYGKQVAASLATPTSENKEYIVQGEHAYNWDDAADLFIRHYKKANVHVLKAPMGMLKLIGRINVTVRYGAKIMEALNNYPEKFGSEQTWRHLGRPSTTIGQYAASL